MGCDIHMIAEKKSRYDYDNDKWQPLLTPIFKDPFYHPERGLSEWNTPYSFQPYEDRNYTLFAILANQRNGYDIKPIDEPRGYPNDMHIVSSYLLNGYDFVDHSPTWLTLEEVLNYPWRKPYKRSGSVNLEDYKIFKENGKPKSWSAGASGGRVEYVSNGEMDDLVSGFTKPDPAKSYYTQIEWEETYADVCQQFLDNMQVLTQYGEDENCDIRLVFGFDN